MYDVVVQLTTATVNFNNILAIAAGRASICLQTTNNSCIANIPAACALYYTSLRNQERFTANVIAKRTEQCHSLQVTTMLIAVASPELVTNAISVLNKLGGGVQASLGAMESEPTLKDAVVCRAATAFRLVPFDAPGADPRVPLVKVQYSFHRWAARKFLGFLLNYRRKA